MVESRRVLIALLVGVAVFWLSTFVKDAYPGTMGMGSGYEVMSLRPFDLVGEFPHRILSPLLAHLLGLGGERYYLFCHGTSVLFLAIVFYACRRMGSALPDALLITVAIGFSGASQLYKHLVGFPDTVTFLLLLVAVLGIHRTVLFWSVVCISYFNHEQVFFLLPALIYLRRRLSGARLRVDAIGLLVTVGLYLGFRWLVGAHAAEQKLTVDFYYRFNHLPEGFLGLSALAVADSLRLFGTLLVVLFWSVWQPRGQYANRALLLYVGGIFAILGIAFDFTRFACLLFLPIVLASIRFLADRRNRIPYAAAILVMIGTYWLLDRLVVPIVARYMAEGDVLVNPMQFGTYVVPKLAPILLGFAAALALFVWLGRWLARLRPQTT